MTFGSKKNVGLRDSGNRKTDKHYGIAAFLSVRNLPLDKSSLKPAAHMYMCKRTNEASRMFVSTQLRSG